MAQRMINAHPSMSFKEAYEHALTLWNKVRADGKKSHDFVFGNRRDLLTTMGRSFKSGTSHAIAASLVHFDILDKTENDEYKLSPQGRDVLSLDQSSDRWRQTAQELVLKPALYRYLFDNYNTSLPNNVFDTLVAKYADRNVNRNNVESIIKNYLESLSFVGLVQINSKESSHFASIHLEEVEQVSLDGKAVPILKRYLLEAYAKTLEENLRQVRRKLGDLQ